MTKSVSKVLTTSTVVAVATTAINQAEALNDHPHLHRLRALQDEVEDASASTSLSMPTNIESINNLGGAVAEEEEEKFQTVQEEEKEPVDLGILMSSIMKNGDLVDTVSQALDQMGGLDKQDLLDELHALAKHFLDSLDHSSTSKSGKTAKSGNLGMNAAVEPTGYLGGLETSDYMSKSGKSESKSGKSEEPSYCDSDPFQPGSVDFGDYCCENSDCVKYELFNINGNDGNGRCNEANVCECGTSEGAGTIFQCCTENSDCESGICNYAAAVARCDED